MSGLSGTMQPPCRRSGERARCSGEALLVCKRGDRGESCMLVKRAPGMTVVVT